MFFFFSYRVTFELTWTGGNLTALCSRECRNDTVRGSLLSSADTHHNQASRLVRHDPPPLPPPPHLSLASSPLWLPKGLKPGLRGDAGLQGEEWPERPREALRLRLLSRPCRLLPPSRLTRRRSRRPVGGGWPSSSPSSWRRVDWGKGQREEGEPSAGGSGTVGPSSGKQ